MLLLDQQAFAKQQSHVLPVQTRCMHGIYGYATTGYIQTYPWLPGMSKFSLLTYQYLDITRAICS